MSPMSTYLCLSIISTTPPHETHSAHLRAAHLIRATTFSTTCLYVIYDLFLFFFQAEDGIRDYKVTGVQTCALPICRPTSVGHLGESRPPQGIAVAAVQLAPDPFQIIAVRGIEAIEHRDAAARLEDVGFHREQTPALDDGERALDRGSGLEGGREMHQRAGPQPGARGPRAGGTTDPHWVDEGGAVQPAPRAAGPLAHGRVQVARRGEEVEVRLIQDRKSTRLNSSH